MCGIAGFWSLSTDNRPETMRDTLVRMTDAIRHRGPDDADHWIDAESGIALGHRRLAIVDLSPGGRQPKQSGCGRYVVTYNGEIYNYRDLRKELEALGHGFRTVSDTEVMLAAFTEWGVEGGLKKLVGMFALAMWDKVERKLILARDRFGEKPLYYGTLGNVFLFGSELKAFHAHPRWTPEIDRDALVSFLRLGYIPAPSSIYKGVFKLPAGTCAVVSGKSGDGLTISPPTAYWSFREVAERGEREPFRGTEAEAADKLESLLTDAVRGQMIADVPLGAFLSGGIDSSTIAALMQTRSGRSVETFTIGFEEPDFNEAEYAGAVARHLGTAHTELYVTPKELLDVVPRLPELYDEPFSDTSQIPTFLVSQLARASVTVGLSGDGADETFGGYLSRYETTVKLWDRLSSVPSAGRRTAGAALARFPFEVAARTGGTSLGQKIRRVGQFAGARTVEDLYSRVISQWFDSRSVVLGGGDVGGENHTLERDGCLRYVIRRMMAFDSTVYLPDDILVKVDRAAMSVSLETRAPFLDHRVVEFAWSLPPDFLVRNGTGKHILKQVLLKHVPARLIDRPKRGFGVPIDRWLRGPLRSWADRLLDEGRLRRQGFFKADMIREMWNNHVSGRQNRQFQLWSVLMFQAWLEKFHPNLASQ